jgi:iron complex outermembrane recepter protein
MPRAKWVVLISSGLCASLANSPRLFATETNDVEGGVQQIQEVIVTAQRRSESLQSVPIAVTAMSADEAANLGITDTASLVQTVPGLTFTKLGIGAIPFIRGVGTNNVAVNNESSVAMYIDGIYQPYNVGNFFSFNNIQRVEVLKGPQGTLFGRNATGGVIQIVTRDPTQDPVADLSFGYGNYDTQTGSVYLSGGVTQNLAADLAVIAEDQRDGWGINLNTGEQQYWEQYIQTRSKWVLTMGDNTTAKLIADYTSMKGSGDNRQQPEGVTGIDGNPNYAGPYNTDQNPESQYYKGGGLALQIDSDFGNFDFVSITSGRKANSYYRSDQDATPINLVDGQVHTSYSNMTQEFQLLSAKKSPFQWVVGAFFYGATAGNDPLRIAGEAAAPNEFFDLDGTQRTRSASLYAQSTFPVLRDTNLTLGARYTYEKETYRGGTFDPSGTELVPLNENDQSYSRGTWRAALDHNFTDTVMGYVSYNRGMKSGGFNLTTGVPYKPEQLDAYEVGFKTEFMNHRLRVNVAVFDYDYKDLQVYLVTLGTQNVQNAASATIRGVDLDLEFVPITNLTLSGGLSYLHGRFDEYANAQAIPANPGPGVTINGAGNSTTYTPPWTANASAQYLLPTGVGEFTLATNVYYNDGFYWTPDNRLRQPVYTVANASLEWQPNKSHFSIRAWINNLNSAKYYATGEEAAGLGDTVGFAPPRTYGVTFHYKM